MKSSRKMKTEMQKRKVRTVPETEKPFVHLISMPESMEVCFTGNENVNPISLFVPFGRWNLLPSFCANFASPEAMKSNSCCSVNNQN